MVMWMPWIILRLIICGERDEKIRFFLLIVITSIGPGRLLAQEDMTFTFNIWVSQGQTKWRHDTQHYLYGRPTSELDYQGIDSQVREVVIFTHLPTGHGLRFTMGTGDIDDGTLVDDDYFSASGAINYGATQSGAHRFSRTHSDIDGSGLFYFKGEFSPKDFMINTSQADIRFSLGLHRWQEEYIATGVRSIECTVPLVPDVGCLPAGSSVLSGVTVITNKVEWTGVGIVMDSLFNFSENFILKLDVTYYPIMRLVNEDIHHLRSDLAQDPSIKMTGNGTGYDLAATLQYHLAENISLHLGYRVWERSVKNQTITFYGASGGSSSADLMNFKTHRDGVVAGFDFQF